MGAWSSDSPHHDLGKQPCQIPGVPWWTQLQVYENHLVPNNRSGLIVHQMETVEADTREASRARLRWTFQTKTITQVWSHHSLRFTSSSRGKCDHPAHMEISAKAIAHGWHTNNWAETQLKRWCLISTETPNSPKPGVAGSSYGHSVSPSAQVASWSFTMAQVVGSPQRVPPEKQHWSAL